MCSLWPGPEPPTLPQWITVRAGWQGLDSVNKSHDLMKQKVRPHFNQLHLLLVRHEHQHVTQTIQHPVRLQTWDAFLLSVVTSVFFFCVVMVMNQQLWETRNKYFSVSSVFISLEFKYFTVIIWKFRFQFPILNLYIVHTQDESMCKMILL